MTRVPQRTRKTSGDASRAPAERGPGRPPDARALERGLELIERGEYFAAHEVFEDLWRAAEPGERDFFQGLVHVAVAWYQAGRRNRIGCERQLAKAERRLAPYAPVHRGLDVARLLAQLGTAGTAYPELPAPVLVRRSAP